jgi:hypothetical protein
VHDGSDAASSDVPQPLVAQFEMLLVDFKETILKLLVALYKCFLDELTDVGDLCVLVLVDVLLEVAINKTVYLSLGILGQLGTPVTIENADSVGVESFELVVDYAVLAGSISLVLHTLDSVVDEVLFEMGNGRRQGRLVGLETVTLLLGLVGHRLLFGRKLGRDLKQLSQGRLLDVDVVVWRTEVLELASEGLCVFLGVVVFEGGCEGVDEQPRSMKLTHVYSSINYNV